MLRHTGGLIFDVLHFCELQQQVYLPWTVPLPSLFQNIAYHQQGECISPVNLYSTLHCYYFLLIIYLMSLDDTSSLISQHRVTSSLKPDFCQCMADSHCFYQIFNASTPNKLVSYFYVRFLSFDFTHVYIFSFPS